MRSDDLLETVLATDLGTPQGVEAAWRELIELIGARKLRPGGRAMRVLREIWNTVPEAARAEGARSLDPARLPAPLVRLFALDLPSVAEPIFLGAQLSPFEWIELLPDLLPSGLATLHRREDLDPAVQKALTSIGAADLELPARKVAETRGAAPAPALVFTQPAPDDALVAAPAVSHAEAEPSPAAELSARGSDDAVLQVSRIVAPALLAAAPEEARQARSDVGRGKDLRKGKRLPSAPIVRPAASFRFETNALGVISWVEGACRGALIGLSLESRGIVEGSRIDASAGGAFRQRAAFASARMCIVGQSDAAGDWLVSAAPVFERATGRFAGYRGMARRPRVDERAQAGAERAASADSLRQLVHELRTPTNAIAGFAEMIESQMLGAVPDSYRAKARSIRAQARELLGAIDDLDLAARIDTAALALVPGAVRLRPLFADIAGDLAPLAELRGAVLSLEVEDWTVTGDRRAVERLLSRLLATLVSASGPGERINVRIAAELDDVVAIAIDRPRALADYPGDSVLGIDDEREDSALLGTGFALRLARNLARELGGSLIMEATTLKLRLRAAANVNLAEGGLRQGADLR